MYIYIYMYLYLLCDRKITAAAPLLQRVYVYDVENARRPTLQREDFGNYVDDLQNGVPDIPSTSRTTSTIITIRTPDQKHSFP